MRRQSIYSQEQECLFFDSFTTRWLKKKYQIQFVKEKEIIYIFNGQIARQIQNFSSSEPDIFYNLEQIKYLEWIGKYGNNFKKTAKWGINWDGQILQKVGRYYSKIFYFILKNIILRRWEKVRLMEIINYELLQNISQVDVFEEGEYYDDLKIVIGCGCYEESQKKIGRWIELRDSFWDRAQVTYNGEYNKKGKKIGYWDINFDRWGDGKYKHIGGGLYSERESQIKIGKWVELDEEFKWEKQVTYEGEYNMKGMKVGRWDISYCVRGEWQYKQIGGGSYGEEEGQIKIGRWVELWERFQWRAQVTYNGEYNITGMKVGRQQINKLLYYIVYLQQIEISQI
ncbi:unnamed protein product [Paramecium sonneborni]|uniref:Uncharacterized protein n=1 Tax=Paramecium sonneborni TaxID=65129 RepID=A0A8S1Q2Z1_9CILI|nr:unnamed protein product [Paramecium sonneborni]